MTVSELRKALQHKMFSDRATIDEAFEYAYMVAKASGNAPYVMTAIHVVLNTAMNELAKCKDYSEAKS